MRSRGDPRIGGGSQVAKSGDGGGGGQRVRARMRPAGDRGMDRLQLVDAIHSRHGSLRVSDIGHQRNLPALRPAVEKLFVPGKRYRRAGVLFFGLENEATAGAPGIETFGRRRRHQRPPRPWHRLFRRDWHNPEVENEAGDALFTVYYRLGRAVGREVTPGCQRGVRGESVAKSVAIFESILGDFVQCLCGFSAKRADFGNTFSPFSGHFAR